MREKILEEKLIANISKMAVLAVSLIVATFAWLSSNTEGSVNQMSVSTLAHNEIAISLNDGISWSNTGTLSIPSDFSFNSEITGDGVNLYRPSTRDSAGAPLTFTSAVANHDYYEFDIMFRSSIVTRVFLEEASYVEPLAGNTSGSLLGTGLVNQSVVGEFSRDLIAGSVRVAFIEHTYSLGEYTLGSYTSLVWAPNKNYEINEIDEVFTASITSNNLQDYKYINVVGGNPSGYLTPINLKDVVSASAETDMAYGDPEIVHTSNKVDNYYYTKATVRIWVEGNDRDALLAVKGGKFKIRLSFVGVDRVEDNVEPSVTADLVLNKLIGFDSAMEYTTNDGITWIKYATNNDPTFDEGTTVLIRKSETSTNYASVSKTLNF